MSFQTVFYEKLSGKILNITPNKYISSKWMKARFVPGYAPNDVNFLYFPTTLPLDPASCRVMIYHPQRPAVVVDQTGLPIMYLAKKIPFLESVKRHEIIIVNFHDSMGDHLYRASCVIEAQKVYPKLRFFCKIESQYKEIMAMIPDITPFMNHKTHDLDPEKCATVHMAPGDLADPLGRFYSAASRYGLFLGLDRVPYDVALSIPQDFDQSFTSFASSIGLRDDGHNVVFQLRTKNQDYRSWDVTKIAELAQLIKAHYDCQIFVLGKSTDFPIECPDIINLAGKTSWMDTVFLLRQASHRFCIDSSVLHLCRALRLPYYALWGGTHPLSVVDQDPQSYDIFSSPVPLHSSMKDITARQVFETAFPETVKAFAPLVNPPEDTSQIGEQEIIFKYFAEHPPTNRTLVDVGAFGKENSNTYQLLAQGWKGILLEPSPERFKIVQEDFAGLDVTILNIAAGTRTGFASFFLHSVAGHDSLVKDWYPESMTDQVVKVPVRPLHELLSECDVPLSFDLLSIDTEGFDFKILKVLFFASDYRPRLIVTENTSYPNGPAFFAKYGYKLLAVTGPEEYGNFIFAFDP